jgi:hypothetical protein
LDVGQIAEDGSGTVSWITQNYQFDAGQLPSVALGSNSTVAMDVHQAQSDDYLWLNPRLGWW